MIPRRRLEKRISICRALQLLFPFIGCFIALLSGQRVVADNVGPINCYKTNGVDLSLEEVRCAPSLPTSPTYCLKANVYDGRVIRDCASSAQCPQGNACAPITYEEDGTTDFVCCCDDDLCNSAPTTNGRSVVALLLALLLIILIAKYGAIFAL